MASCQARAEQYRDDALRDCDACVKKCDFTLAFLLTSAVLKRCTSPPIIRYHQGITDRNVEIAIRRFSAALELKKHPDVECAGVQSAGQCIQL